MRRSLRYISTLCGASLIIMGAVAATPAAAETLREALVKAYQTNPTLSGDRARQRAADENVPIAKADALPDLRATGSYTEYLVQSQNSFNAPTRQAFAGLDLQVPIYRGGAVRNGIAAAQKRVDAGRGDLRGTEASVFSMVVGAYMDVIRDQAIVQLNQANVRVLETNLQATRDRFEVGDLTRTDIAQSQARLSLSQSQLRSAEAALINSREQYIRLVGEVPVGLEPPPPLPNLPETPDSAVDIALDDNPDIQAAVARREAAKFDVGVARANRLPRLTAVAGGNYNNYLGTLGTTGGGANAATDAQVGLQATIPLFQGGRPAAQIRQAQAFSGQAIEQQIEVERSVIAQARASFASWRASLAVIESQQQAVDANSLSLEGVRAENSVGNRTILDILNAEQELLNSQVQLVTARRDAYVAGFTLLAAMGRAEARDLGLDGGPLYDPVDNYDKVHNNIWDWSGRPDPKPEATRTVDTPAQTPSVEPLPERPIAPPGG